MLSSINPLTWVVLPLLILSSRLLLSLSSGLDVFESLPILGCHLWPSGILIVLVPLPCKSFHNLGFLTQFLFSAAHNFVHCLNLVLIHYWLLSLRFTLLHIACSNMSSLRINKFCLHQSSWWLYRLRRVTNFCLLSWDLPIILWVTFRAYSLLFLPAKAMQNNFRKFEELVFYNLWFLDSGFRIPDSGFRFPIPDSGFRFRIPVSGF